MSGTIVPLIWQTYINGVEKKDVSMRIGLAQNFVRGSSGFLVGELVRLTCLNINFVRGSLSFLVGELVRLTAAYT